MLDQEIRQKITAYLDGSITAQELNKWVGEATWDVHNSGNTEAVRLTGKVELWLAELSHGHLTEAEFKHDLRELIGSAQRLVFIVGSGVTVKKQSGADASTVYLQASLGAPPN